MAEKNAHRIVVAGGGIAAIEFVLALRALIGDNAAIRLISPNPDLVLRPSLVAAPLGLLARQSYPMADLASDIGFTRVPATVSSVDAERRRVIVRGGDAIAYDTLVLALGARTLPVFDDAIHLGDAEGARGLESLHQEVGRGGAVRTVAFVVPSRAGRIRHFLARRVRKPRRIEQSFPDLVAEFRKPLPAGFHSKAPRGEARRVGLLVIMGLL